MTSAGLVNEINLIQDVKAEPDAFAPVYEYYFPKVYNYVRYRVEDAQVTDDLTSQIFEQALGKIYSYKADVSPFGAWLFAIARNKVSDYFRKKKRRRWFSWDAMEGYTSDYPALDESTQLKDDQMQLLRAVSQLTGRERDVIALKFAADMTNVQISQLTGLSESNVGVILYRAIRKLRGMLHGLFHDDEEVQS
ncbi:MAG: sigma-70 family RNA polymerase sigma factor [Aggregatilineales bacterium]